MRSNVLLLVAAAVLAATGAPATGQLSTEKVGKYFAAAPGGAQLSAVAVGTPVSVVLLTPTFPVSFSRLEKVTDPTTLEDEWRVGADVSIGASYVLMVGKGTKRADNSYDVRPTFVIGVTGNVGVVSSPEGGLEESFMLGGVLGLAGFSALVGYDFLGEGMILGVGARVDLVNLTDGLTHIISIK